MPGPVSKMLDKSLFSPDLMVYHGTGDHAGTFFSNMNIGLNYFIQF